MMRITFKNFPYDFDSQNNVFRSLLSDVEVEQRNMREIDFYGCYPKKSLASKAILYAKSKIKATAMTDWLNFQNGNPISINPNKLNFWSTFENRRPPADPNLFTFSFDVDSYNGTNFYLPLIYLYMDLEIGNPYTPRHSVTQAAATSPRTIPSHLVEKKVAAACTFISNPHPMRLRAIQEFSKNRKVDIFGRYSGNYVQDKVKQGESYWLNFCFENDLFPGYVTEKALEAWLSYSIPVYWGDDAAGILNPKAIVNLKEFKSMRDFQVYLEYLLNNESMMLEMISQPILKKKLDISELRNFILSAASPAGN